MSNDEPAPAHPARAKRRQPRMIADISRACWAGRHIPGPDVRIDDQGIEHAQCRHCGCALARMPVLRRWFRIGVMG